MPIGEDEMIDARLLRAASRLALVLAPCLATPALAQETGAPPRGLPDAQGGDIIVTAQRIGNQRLIDTQLSVSAITGDQLDRTGRDNLQSVLASVPGLSSTPTSGGSDGLVTFQIRGS